MGEPCGSRCIFCLLGKTNRRGLSSQIDGSSSAPSLYFKPDREVSEVSVLDSKQRGVVASWLLRARRHYEPSTEVASGSPGPLPGHVNCAVSGRFRGHDAFFPWVHDLEPRA